MGDDKRLRGGGEWQEISPHPSVGVIYWTLQPWLWRITGCGTSISFRLFFVGIHKPLICEVNGWRIYLKFKTSKSFILNSDTMLLTLPFRWTYVVFIGNLEEGLKICCFIVLEIGDERRVFPYLATSYAPPRSSLFIGSFYLCLPEVQSCKDVYLYQKVVTCGNLEIVSSPMSGLEKSFIPFCILVNILLQKGSRYGLVLCFR
ncbi:hypothetical protein V6N12_002627 [Hibiscus sabdariffa]|uniref:Uncharacterized protein n=1 Tax=Hibiscus sabdariffa TaxID=183260 RepID=A0ABR2E9I7_9ROSI